MMMDTTTATIISTISATLSVIFLVINFSRSKGMDSTKLENRLTVMEQDIKQIKISLEELKEMNKTVTDILAKYDKKIDRIETRLDSVESRIDKLEKDANA